MCESQRIAAANPQVGLLRDTSKLFFGVSKGFGHASSIFLVTYAAGYGSVALLHVLVDILCVHGFT